MEAINIYEAKTHLSKLLARVEQGEEILIARGGRPIARLVPLECASDRRVPGLDKGQISYADDFHEALLEELAELFEA